MSARRVGVSGTEVVRCSGVSGEGDDGSGGGVAEGGSGGEVVHVDVANFKRRFWTRGGSV